MIAELNLVYDNRPLCIYKEENMNNIDEFNNAISFMRDANKTLKNVRICERTVVNCSCCCASHGGGKAKYEEKYSVNNRTRTKTN